MLDKRDSLLHKSLNGGHKLKAADAGVAISVAETPGRAPLTSPACTLSAVDAVVCLENHADRSRRPRSRSSGIRGLVLSRGPRGHGDEIRTKGGGGGEVAISTRIFKDFLEESWGRVGRPYNCRSSRLFQSDNYFRL